MSLPVLTFSDLFESTTIVIGRTCDGDSVSTGKMGCRMERNKLALFS